MLAHSPLNEPQQAAPAHELHNDVVRVFFGARPEHLNNMGVPKIRMVSSLFPKGIPLLLAEFSTTGQLFNGDRGALSPPLVHNVKPP
jgi:hypothetical protein